MKNHIIGTAGHVDHGKTALIRALTGMDTSHLEEEKRRGITIDLGFAWLELPGGGRAGIVDVPGHERFVKNMLAGAGGMDLVLLVVAADEGFMPQTREHLDILSLLNVPGGIIVLTKTDLVDRDWLELVQEEIREEVQDSFLASAPMVCVSCRTGQGVEELRRLIVEMLSEEDNSREALSPRLPIDRVFSVDGFGTVATGTLIQGVLSEGREVTLWPGQLPAKIRSLQVHGQKVPRAFAGQRTAVNLTGVRREQVIRGGELAAPDSLEPSLMLDVQLKALPRCGRALKNGSRLHFHQGAGVSLCKLVLLDREVLNPGEEAPAQLRFTQPVAVKNGDRFVVRFYSPVETVGGGAVLNCHPRKHKRFDGAVLEGLALLNTGTEKEKLLRAFYDDFPQPADPRRVSREVNLPEEVFAGLTRELIGEGALIALSDRALLHREQLNRLGDRLTGLLEEYHRSCPMEPGMKREEVRAKLLPGWEAAPANRLLELLAEEKRVEEREQRLCLPGFAVQLSPAREQLMKTLSAEFRKGGFEPRSLEELRDRYAGNRELRPALDALFRSGELVALSPQSALHREFFDRAREALEAFCRKEGGITLGQFRDLLGISRKYALLLLECFDRRGLTKKTGEVRVLTN